MQQNHEVILAYQRLVLMWCFVLVNQFKQMQNFNENLDTISQSTDPAKFFNDVFVTHEVKLKDTHDSNIDVNNIELGDLKIVSGNYRLFDPKTNAMNFIIIFPVYCFALANILFHPTEVIQSAKGGITDTCCAKDSNTIFPLSFNECTFKEGGIKSIFCTETGDSVKIEFNSFSITIEQRPEFENLPRPLQKQINIFREALKLDLLPLPEQKKEKDKVLAQSSCARCVITGASCFLSFIVLSVMFATIFPNAFAFINFPHLINNAFLGCVISAGIVGGLSLIFFTARIICAIFFHEIIWNKATETDSSRSSRFLCKVLGGYPKVEKQIDESDKIL